MILKNRGLGRMVLLIHSRHVIIQVLSEEITLANCGVSSRCERKREPKNEHKEL